jgi:hypothetical protein
VIWVAAVAYLVAMVPVCWALYRIKQWLNDHRT